MTDRAWAEKFACDWIESWNSHDLDRILAHYADDVVMVSPLIVLRLGITEGTLRGKRAVGHYWAQALAHAPDLCFRLIDVVVGVHSVALVYESVSLRRTVVECIEFNEQRLGARAEALYGPIRRETVSDA